MKKLSLVLSFVVLFLFLFSVISSAALKTLYSVTLTNAADDWWDCGVQYGRLLVLKNQGNSDDGAILVTHCELNAGVENYKPRYPVYKSKDNGKNWALAAFVTDELTGANSEWNPFLFELEQDCGKYKKGTIILAGCSIDPEHKKESYIRLYFSTDGGYTFDQGVIVASGGGLEEGVWEPFLLQLDDGTLVCYYSDDSDPEHSQKIVYKTSDGLENWSEAKDVVATEIFEERPGMPVVTRLGDGSYFMVYEVVDKDGVSGNPVYSRRSQDGLNWGDPEYIGEEIIDFSSKKALGSAPFCAWTPMGGENGTLIVSGTFMRKGESSTGSDLFISDDNGRSFVAIPHMISYTAENNVGYSNSFAFSQDGKYMYLINNPQNPENPEKSRMVVATVDFEKSLPLFNIEGIRNSYIMPIILLSIVGVVCIAIVTIIILFVKKKRKM